MIQSSMSRNPQPMSPSVEQYSLSYIRPRHKEIARRLVLGQTQTEICRDLNMSTSRMSIICNSPLFKILVSKLEEERNQDTVDVGKQLREIAPNALEIVERTMYNGATESLKLKAAESILDRAGFSTINKAQIEVSHVPTENFTKEELIKLVAARFQKMSAEKEAKELEIIKAESIEVKFDELPIQQPTETIIYGAE